jgi:hypothetical protein
LLIFKTTTDTVSMINDSDASSMSPTAGTGALRVASRVAAGLAAGAIRRPIRSGDQSSLKASKATFQKKSKALAARRGAAAASGPRRLSDRGPAHHQTGIIMTTVTPLAVPTFTDEPTFTILVRLVV